MREPHAQRPRPGRGRAGRRDYGAVVDEAEDVASLTLLCIPPFEFQSWVFLLKRRGSCPTTDSDTVIPQRSKKRWFVKRR